MPGLVRDPVNNARESRFGFLIDYNDGHIKPILKEDESARYYPANSRSTLNSWRQKSILMGREALIPSR